MLIRASSFPQMTEEARSEVAESLRLRLIESAPSQEEMWAANRAELKAMQQRRFG